MNGYAVDTNIISFMLRGDKKLQTKVLQEVSGGNDVIIPPIVYYEIKRGLIDYHAPAKLAAFEKLCGMLGAVDMDTKTLDIAAGIYAALKKVGKLIEDSDILIAASCIAHGYTLVTNNTKHFTGITGLNLEDWTI